MQDFAHYQLLTRGFIYKARYFSFDGRKTLSCITGKKKQKKRQQIGWKKNRESDGKNWLRAFKASNRKKKWDQ